MSNILQRIKSILTPKSGKFFTSNLLYNRSILYFFLLVTLLDLYYLSVTNDYLSVSIFIITAILVSFFNKNMIVIMIIGLAVMHMLKFGIKSTLNEGMTTTSKPSEDQHDTGDSGDKTEGSNDNGDSDTSDLEKKTKMMNDINDEMVEFNNLQQKILKGLNDISPLMDKAESFIERIETRYKSD